MAKETSLQYFAILITQWSTNLSTNYLEQRAAGQIRTRHKGPPNDMFIVAGPVFLSLLSPPLSLLIPLGVEPLQSYRGMLDSSQTRNTDQKGENFDSEEIRELTIWKLEEI
jgi:hypothetical protein